MWYKNLDRFFFHFVTIHAFDRQTDRQTPFSSLVSVGIPCRLQCGNNVEDHTKPTVTKSCLLQVAIYYKNSHYITTAYDRNCPAIRLQQFSNNTFMIYLLASKIHRGW